MEHLMNVVENYLQRSRENNGYALLLNGAWGKGKTFYFERVLKKKIETIKNNENNKPYKVLYVSLNGLSKTTEIANAVLNEKFHTIGGLGYWFNLKDNEVSKYKADRVFNGLFNCVGAAIEKFKNNSLQKDDKEFIKKLNVLAEFGDDLICFDDLERCAIPINEVLGFINTHFVERHKLKTIIIANEAEIPQNDIYKKIKEKVIGRTIEFEPNTEEIAKAMFENSNLAKLWPHSLELKALLNGRQWNLRALSLAFEHTKTLLELVSDYITNLDTRTWRNEFIKTFISYVFEFVYYFQLQDNHNCYFLTEGLAIKKFEIPKDSSQQYVDYNLKFREFNFLCRQEIVEFIVNGCLYRDNFCKVFKQKMTEYEDDRRYTAAVNKLSLIEERTTKSLEDGFEKLKTFFVNSTTKFISLSQFIDLAEKILEVVQENWFSDRYKHKNVIAEFIRDSNFYFNNIPKKGWPIHWSSSEQIILPENFCGGEVREYFIKKHKIKIADMLKKEQKFEKSLFVEKFQEFVVFCEPKNNKPSSFDWWKKIIVYEEAHLVELIWNTVKNGYDWEDFIEICENPKQQAKEKSKMLKALEASLSNLEKLNKDCVQRAIELVEKWPEL